MQGAVAAGLLGCGSVILGASENAGRMFVEIDQAAVPHAGDLRAAARAVVGALREQKQAIPGYGHPEHKRRDARVDALFEVSARVGGGQRFVEIAKVVEEILPEVVGKDLKLNVSAAIPAVLLGVGFPVKALRGVPLLARTASLVAHLNEELEDPVGFALTYQATREFLYTGRKPGDEP
jgi:citrate synthase